MKLIQAKQCSSLFIKLHQRSLWDHPVISCDVECAAISDTHLRPVLRPPWLQLTNQFFESLGHRFEVPKLHGYGSK